MKDARAAGKPPQSQANKLRARVWMAAVAHQAGLTPDQIERDLEPEKVRREGGRTIQPHKWRRYSSGENVPSDKDASSPVELAETRWPGTAGWFRSPIWRALETEPIASSEADRLLSDLPTLGPKLMVPTREGSNVMRRAEVGPMLIASVLAVGGLEALAAALIWARLAEDIHSPELRESALRMYRHLQSSLAKEPALHSLGQDLFRTIDLAIKEWVYPDQGSVMHVVMFSDEIRRASEEGAP